MVLDQVNTSSSIGIPRWGHWLWFPPCATAWCPSTIRHWWAGRRWVAKAESWARKIGKFMEIARESWVLSFKPQIGRERFYQMMVNGLVCRKKSAGNSGLYYQHFCGVLLIFPNSRKPVLTNEWSTGVCANLELLKRISFWNRISRSWFQQIRFRSCSQSSHVPPLSLRLAFWTIG